MTTDARRLSDIESELDTSRERMERTLNALEHRLSSQGVLERGRGYLRATGGDEFVFNLGRSVRRNPVPLTFLGIGIGWLMLSGSERAGRTIAHNTPDWNRGDASGAKTSDAAATARQHTKSAGRSLQHNAEQAADAAGRAGRGASHMAENSRRTVARTGARLADGAEYMYREQPLLSSVLGLALGAVVAASVPRSDPEDRAFGSTRDDLMASARETGREKAAQAQSVAESAAGAARDAARSEADRQGLYDQES